MPRSDETLVRTVMIDGTPYVSLADLTYFIDEVVEDLDDGVDDLPDERHDATLIVFMALRAQLTELALRS